jgi:deoxyribodipyrimidine photo-lyase
MIHGERVQRLNRQDVRSGDYVLYWMQHAQRASGNHALVYAIREANRQQLPLVAVFGITQRFPDANTRSYTFMLEGLQETRRALRNRGIQLVVQLKPPVEAVTTLARNASLVVVDCGYLRIERRWRERAAERLPCRLVQVETDVVVPVATVSQKEEYAAYTIRPKIHKHLDTFLVPLEETPLQRGSLDLQIEHLGFDDVDGTVHDMRINRSADAVKTFRGGASQAEALLEQFIVSKLHAYADRRNEPSDDFLSHMSPYLHFGQISPLYVAQRVRQAEGVDQENQDAYLEELVVRRELSMNFCTYNPDYDNLACLPDWARETLDEHAADRREYIYGLEAFEQARTHDAYWNAAQQEMVLTGKMHGYMRMYWGKKILEWTPGPGVAHRVALELNNRYEIDGRDANGYTGVAWCFGKHDRAWAERDVYGKVRYMSAGGLERKFDIDRYVRQVRQLAEAKGE